MSTKSTTSSPPDIAAKMTAKEMKEMRAQLTGMEILLQQNAELEKEIERLNNELDEVTLGVQKKGYLYKWREREIFYASKWGLRYFVLQGNKIAYYGNDQELRPRRTIDLTNCYVRDEGKKKGGIYHMFSVYLGENTNNTSDDSTEGSLILRCSSESSAEVALWIDMLEQGCAFNRFQDTLQEGTLPPLNTPVPQATTSNIIENDHDIDDSSASKHISEDGNDQFLVSVPLSVQVPLRDHGAEISPGKGATIKDGDGDLGRGEGDEQNEWGHSHVVSSHDNLANLVDLCDMPELKQYASREKLLPPLSVGGSDITPVVDSSGENNSITRNNEVTENADGKDEPIMLPMAMLRRVKSASKVLQKSLSRQTFARRILASRAPQDFSKSGTRLSSLRHGTNAASSSSAAAAANSTSSSSSSSSGGGGSLPVTAGSASAKGGGQRSNHKSFPAYKPMHVQSQTSPLSPDSGKVEHNFRGFFNLGVILLVLSHLEMIINNLLKYGLKASVPFIWKEANEVLPLRDIHLSMKDVPFFESPYVLYCLPVLLHWFGGTFLVYGLELMAARRIVPESMTLLLHCVFSTVLIVYPCVFVWSNDGSVGANMTYLFQSVIIWMKLISYVHANRSLRLTSFKSKKADLDASKRSRSNLSVGAGGSGGGGASPIMEALSRTSSGDNFQADDNNAKPYNDQMARILAECSDLQPPFLLYPQNITVANLGYFMIAPTLCYQLNYPRTARIRWSAVMFILFRLVVVGAIMIFSAEQYIAPTLETSIEHMQKSNFFMITERLLKLSIPNTYIWLLGFYFFFHLWLNLLAELTRFGDRQFYKEWWNARTIESYWRTWNMPVHHWITRHFYYPLLRLGVNKTVSTILVFAFSAALHELIISVPFRYIAMHAFLGMFGQVPLIIVTRYIDRHFDNAFIGNAMFWCLFCIIGQPIGILLMSFDLWKIAHPHHADTAASVAAGILTAAAAVNSSSATVL
mmetsp:Transcript_8230/g.13669  ORF Transcript_8230/g.13669 Transcript_8230/m.13669 type:complete len:976 (-) Transcript_8230:1086-4013(-)